MGEVNSYRWLHEGNMIIFPGTLNGYKGFWAYDGFNQIPAIAWHASSGFHG
jgi:hypothetical protein